MLSMQLQTFFLTLNNYILNNLKGIVEPRVNDAYMTISYPGFKGNTLVRLTSIRKNTIAVTTYRFGRQDSQIVITPGANFAIALPFVGLAIQQKLVAFQLTVTPKNVHSQILGGEVPVEFYEELVSTTKSNVIAGIPNRITTPLNGWRKLFFMLREVRE